MIQMMVWNNWNTSKHSTWPYSSNKICNSHLTTKKYGIFFQTHITKTKFCPLDYRQGCLTETIQPMTALISFFFGNWLPACCMPHKRFAFGLTMLVALHKISPHKMDSASAHWIGALAGAVCISLLHSNFLLVQLPLRAFTSNDKSHSPQYSRFHIDLFRTQS